MPELQLKILKQNSSIAELLNIGEVINTVDDAVDLLGNASYLGASKIILKEEQLHPNFFKLNTRLAGDILQKFSNYNMKLVIIGEFEKYQSKSLNDFIRECNRGRLIYFTNSHKEALSD